MNYEEKREMRLQISQLLADAGLNQYNIKKIVEEEIKNKVQRALDQTIKQLNANSSSGDYFDETIKKLLNKVYINQSAFDRAVKNELQNRIIKIEIVDNTNIKGETDE